MKNSRKLLDVLLYVIVFLLLQWVVSCVVVAVQFYRQGAASGQILEQVSSGTLLPSLTSMVVISIVSSLLTLVCFLALRWCPMGRSYLRSWPLAVYAWVVILALGTVIPSEYLSERIPYEMPPEMEALLAGMLQSRWGYLAIGLLTPWAEEVVFRGAVLRVLLQMTGRRWHWVAIGLSALVFGVVHGNVPQGLHAALIGLLLGWMYYRTQSIVPGVLFHWVNNSVAYVVVKLFPQASDLQLSDVLQGGERGVLMAVAFSFCLILPALYQLHLRLKRSA